MSFSVVTNISSLNSQAQLDKTSMGLQQTLARLTSGLRINSSADDAAGLAVANRFRMDGAGLATGIRSANDAISRLQIEDGAMSNISSLLDRALTLATQAASDTFLGSRTTLDSEFSSVLSEITRTATSAGLETSNSNLNGRSVFVGNTQIATGASVSYVSFALTTAVDSTGLGISSQNITSQANANTAITNLQTAIATLGTVQGRAGAAMNRLQFAISQGQTMAVSIAASESRIRDANVAEEAASLTKYNILNQSGLAALAQANQSSQSVLSLLR
jgi:flagellin